MFQTEFGLKHSERRLSDSCSPCAQHFVTATILGLCLYYIVFRTKFQWLRLSKPHGWAPKFSDYFCA